MADHMCTANRATQLSRYAPRSASLLLCIVIVSFTVGNCPDLCSAQPTRTHPVVCRPGSILLNKIHAKRVKIYPAQPLSFTRPLSLCWRRGAVSAGGGRPHLPLVYLCLLALFPHHDPEEEPAVAPHARQRRGRAFGEPRQAQPRHQEHGEKTGL